MIGEKARQPGYYKQFKCTEDKCRSNCCQHNWEIRIDKETYDNFSKLGKPEQERICECIKVTNENPFAASIIMNENGKCSLLEPNGLCSIHKNYGPDYLSNTCRIYPRYACVVDGKLEAYLSLSCEAVAELVLFQKEPVKLENAILAHDSKGRVIYSHMLETSKYTSAANAVEIFYKLREVSAAIIQLKQFNMRFRMLLLCMFIQEIEQHITAKQDSSIVRSADSFLQRIEAGSFDELAGDIPNGADLNTDIILSILKEMSEKKDEQFVACLNNAMAGHGFAPGSWTPPTNFPENFNEFRKQYFSDKEYIIENYITNSILSEGFPFNYQSNKNEVSIMMNLAGLLAKYDMVEFLLVGTCRYNNGFDKQAVADCVSYFCKVYEHNLKGYLNYG